MEDLGDPRKFIRFRREPIAVDILPAIDGISFDEAWGRRVESVIDESSGLTAFLFPGRTLLPLNSRQTGCAILPMLKTSERPRPANRSGAKPSNRQMLPAVNPIRELRLCCWRRFRPKPPPHNRPPVE